jgi:TRAP-type C4-dicarboxylate transport system permease small subunit
VSERVGALARIGRGLRWLEDGLLTALVIALVLLAGGQIVARLVWEAGFLWADSLLRTLVLWTALLGAMAAARENKHLAVDAVDRFVHGVPRRAARLLVQGFAAFICAVMAWYCWELVKLEREGGTEAFLGVPVWVTQLILPFAFAVMTWRFGWRALSALWRADEARA